MNPHPTKPLTITIGSPFADRVKVELRRARTKHPGKQHSAHEGFAVLYEEVDELWDLVKAQTPKTEEGRDQKRQQMLEELVQIAAMAQRTAEDLGLI